MVQMVEALDSFCNVLISSGRMLLRSTILFARRFDDRNHARMFSSLWFILCCNLYQEGVALYYKVISRNTVCNFKPNGSIFKNASIPGSAFLFQASMHNLRFAQFQSKDIIVSYREGVISINKMLFRSQHYRSAWLLFTWNYTYSAWNSHLYIEIKFFSQQLIMFENFLIMLFRSGGISIKSRSIMLIEITPSDIKISE